MADQDKKPDTAEEVEEIEEINTDGAGGDSAAAAGIPSELMLSPEMLAAIQDRLGGMAISTPASYIQSLPKVVKRRLKALKKLQFDMIKIESKFYEEVHELECRYASKYAPLVDKRKEIVSGGIEPTDSDCEWPSDEEDEADQLADEMGQKAKITEIDETKEGEQEKKEEEKDETVKGVPEFWLTMLKNVDLLSDMIQEHDEPILGKLVDLKVKFSESNPMGFTLEFHFEPNEFFTNAVLTKEYIMKSDPDTDDPFSFEGPEIIKCKGCAIDWKKGKNVTVKVIKKTQKHKNRGTTRTVTKSVQNDSFFNFFAPPEVADGEEPDEDTEALLAADFEIGHFIRERIVPRAVLYFTGEALEDDDEYDEESEGEEEGEEEEGDYDEDGDPDFNPAAGGPGNAAAPECKQQ